MAAKNYEQGWSAIAARDRGHVRHWRNLRIRGYQLFDDETLVRCARAKDDTAFLALVGRYRDRLYTMALRSLGNVGDAGDALCEMSIAAYKDVHSAGASSATGAWLYLHGLRAVLSRLNPERGRYAIEKTYTCLHPPVNAMPTPVTFAPR